jgi:inorganic pyrophosphatase
MRWWGNLDAAAFDVLIEIPRGSRKKYEVDHASDRVGSTAPCSPPRSTPVTTASSRTPLGEDGDPFDALVTVGQPLFPSC